MNDPENEEKKANAERWLATHVQDVENCPVYRKVTQNGSGECGKPLVFNHRYLQRPQDVTKCQKNYLSLLGDR